MLLAPPARPGRGWEILLAVLAALAAGAAGGYLVGQRAGTASVTPNGDAGAPRAERVTALGRLQPAGGVVPVYGPPGDRVAELYPVPVGKPLKEGAEISKLASWEERNQQVKVAETQLAEAEKALAAAERAGEQRILAARAELSQAQANKASDLAAVDARLKFLEVQKRTADGGVARLVKLRKDGGRVEEEVFEKAQLLAAQAEAELKATEATRRKTETGYEEGEKAAAAKIKAAEAELAEAKARAPIESSREQLNLAKQLRDRTVIRAPITGTVLRVGGREGQPTGTEPLLQMADLAAMTAVAEVYENDVERVSKWAAAGPVRAEVRNPALPRPLAGAVRSQGDIARMIARNQVFALGPREDADRRVVEVVVHLDAAATELAGRFVGLQVTVTLEPGPSHPRHPMTPLRLAWSNLAHKRARTAVAAGGVAFAVILVFMELGFLGGVGRTATMLFDSLAFDLVLTSPEYLDVSRSGEFPRSRLAQARAADGVAEVIPLSVGAGGWRLPTRRGLFGTVPGGGVMSINILAVPPGLVDRAFAVGPGGVFPTAEDARAGGAALARLDAFLFDRRSKPEFGDAAALAAASRDGSGEPVRLNGKRAVVAGHFDLGTGFSWNGMLMTSEETFARFTGRNTGGVHFGLVQLRPGADPAAVQRELRAVLPPDVTVRTRDEVNADERRYWVRLTSVGQFLVVAVVLAVVVGVIFVYQMMAADIRNMLPEYATVKALGYRPSYLTGVVMWQAGLLALLGYVPGFVASLGLYAAAAEWGGIPTGMTAGVAAGVLVLTLGMCLASGLLAVRKVHAADPADLF